MPRCGRPARRAVSRRARANEKNPALGVDRKPLGTSKRASHPARPVPAVAPHGPRCSADACRSAIGRPILRPVRKVVRGILALGDYPLPVPLYGEPRVLPAAAFDPRLHRRLAAELEAAAGQSGASVPTIESGACCRDGHGHAQQVSEVAARRRDDVPVDAADPPAPACHGDGRESRPTGTVPEGIVPSRAQLRIAAAGLEPATPGL